MNKHPLADYVRILARGKNASRSMTREEAEFTMSHLLSGDFEPEQLGALLMLLRVKEETPEELAGFSAAINAQWPSNLNYDLVWPSYAGKRRQPFWCLLSAMLLRNMGYRILFHGTQSHTEGRIYLHEVFEQLGLPTFARIEEVAQANAPSLAYLPCEAINPEFQRWLSLKSILGVRSPINTILKTISPPGIPSVQGIFHPSYAETHTGAAQLNNTHMVVIKGEGGEFEVNPERKCVARFQMEGVQHQVTITNQRSYFDDKPEGISAQLLTDVWERKLESQYAEQAVISTAALALMVIRKTTDLDAALEECKTNWEQRSPGFGE